MTIVTNADFKAADICARCKIWFKRHNLDYNDFLQNGIESDKLLATGDFQEQVARVIAKAKERQARDG